MPSIKIKDIKHYPNIKKSSKTIQKKEACAPQSHDSSNEMSRRSLISTDLSQPSPSRNLPSDSAELQQRYGNQYIQRVMRQQAEAVPWIQRQGDEEEEEPVQTKMNDTIHRQTEEAEEDEEEPIQAKMYDAAQRQADEEEGEPVQTKLSISQPGDKFEQEADRVAEQVMSMPDSQVQRQEEDERLQTKRNTFKAEKINSGQARQTYSANGEGKPLSKSIRNFFEIRFGKDFNQVRVHTDTRAVEMARMLNARAFTSGRNIAFGSGQYSAETMEGKKLLAHELTHVVQQGAAKKINCNPVMSEPRVNVQQVVIQPQIQRWVLPTDWLDYIGLGIDLAERLYIELAYDEGEEKDFKRFVNNLFFALDLVLAALPAIGGGGLVVRGSHSAAVFAWQAIPDTAKIQVATKVAQLTNLTLSEAIKKINIYMSASNKGGGGTPRSNVAQNKQFNDAVRAAEKRLNRKLSQDQIRMLHDEISGMNYGFHEIIEIAVDMFAK